MEQQKTILSYAHLHAYTDHELVDQRRVDVDDFVKTHPKLNIHIREYQFINEQLHELYDGVLREPVPECLIAMVKNPNSNRSMKRSRWRTTLYTIFMGMVLGGIIGVLLHQYQSLELIAKAKTLFETFISQFI